LTVDAFTEQRPALATEIARGPIAARAARYDSRRGLIVVALEGAFGSDRWMQQIGKLGGLRRSAIKAKASRENGKRGGRPKNKVAA
jgi:hypothetical protein